MKQNLESVEEMLQSPEEAVSHQSPIFLLVDFQKALPKLGEFWEEELRNALQVEVQHFHVVRVAANEEVDVLGLEVVLLFVRNDFAGFQVEGKQKSLVHSLLVHHQFCIVETVLVVVQLGLDEVDLASLFHFRESHRVFEHFSISLEDLVLVVLNE